MKTHVLSLLLLFFVNAAAAGGATEAVIAAEHARRDALLSSDATALGALLSDELRYTHSNGRLETKADVVNGIANKTTAYERFELDRLVALPITKEVVVLTGAIDQRKLGNGNWSDARLLFHAVWRNESGTWRLISLQTALPPAPHS